MKTLSLHKLKDDWTEACFSGKVFSYKNHPLRSHPLAKGLIDPRSSPGCFQGLSFSELCQLAILRAPYDGGSLLNALDPLTSFPTLWSQEENFDREETIRSIDLLQYVLGKREAPEGELSPYFEALLKLGKIGGDKKTISPLALVESWGPIDAAFIQQGKGTSLGALRVGTIEIPAFGPHLHPLNQSSFFGVDIDSSNWALLSADREIWVHRTNLGSGFEIQVFGLSPKKRVSFVFYLLAEKGRINGRDFFPKTLSRFSDPADDVLFENNGTTLNIKSTSSVKVELIPLAGDSSYFGSTFLLAFEVPTFDGKLGFQFS